MAHSGSQGRNARRDYSARTLRRVIAPRALQVRACAEQRVDSADSRETGWPRKHESTKARMHGGLNKVDPFRGFVVSGFRDPLFDCLRRYFFAALRQLIAYLGSDT
jgi:hypothetical protein